MKSQRGLSLIELVIFIIVMGIMASGALIAFNNVLNNNSTPGTDLQAAQLADARMNILLMKRLINGFPLASDPCATPPTPPTIPACLALYNYANSVGLTATASIGTATAKTSSSIGSQTATVTVTGTGTATNLMVFAE